MKQNLQDLVVVITGAGSGIGRAIAVTLGEHGVRLVLLGGRNECNLEETAQLVNSKSECMLIPGDIKDLGYLKESVSAIVARFGKIDVLINNAGTPLRQLLSETCEKDFDAVMDTNVKAPYFLIQYALPYIMKSKNATIINIVSSSGHSGYPLQSAYTASKHAILGFTKSLANELYEKNVRVHALSPGGVYTAMVKAARPDLDGTGMIDPSELGAIVEFLLLNRGNGIIDEIKIHRSNKEPFCI